MRLKLPIRIWRRLAPRLRTRGGRTLLIGAGVILTFTAAALLLARGVVGETWPETDGTLRLKGLRTPVTVVRDHYGVPHIYADNLRDLSFAQGYVHAQDRFWGMEVSRRRGRGELAGLAGEEMLVSDQAWQTLGLPAVAERELARMDPAARALLDAYAAGVNAWLQEKNLPFEFTLSEWQEHGGELPKPWTAEDSLLTALVLAWQASGPRIDPAIALQVAERVGPEQAAFLLDGSIASWAGPEWLVEPLPGAGAGAEGETLPPRWSLSGQVALVETGTGPGAGTLSAVNLPMGLDLPAPWYVLAWYMDGEAAAGASVPGLPGLIVSHADGAVWTAANPETTLSTVPPWTRWLLASLLHNRTVWDPAEGHAIATVEELSAALADTFSPRAARLIPLLTQFGPEDWQQERVTDMLEEWDFRIVDDSPQASFFAMYQLELARAAFADELGEELFNAYVAHAGFYQAALDSLLDDLDNEWWDDVTTPERELRDGMLQRAYDPALERIGRIYGDLHTLWEWNVMHSNRLRHPLSDAWIWDELLDRVIAPDGWTDTLYASPGGLPFFCAGAVEDPEQGRACLVENLFRASSVFGYRQLVDTRDPSTVWFTLVPGQSAHPLHPHYDDLLEEGLDGEYVPLRLAPVPGDVEEPEGVLVLAPGR